VPLLEMIAALEKQLGKAAEKRFLPMQAGDVPETYADVKALTEATGFSPSTPIETGIARFVEWYRAYYLNGGHKEGVDALRKGSPLLEATRAGD